MTGSGNVVLPADGSAAAAVVAEVRFEHLISDRGPVTLGIGTGVPRVSFSVMAPDGWRQTGYEVEARQGGRVTTSGKLMSGDSVLVPWPGAPLPSRTRADVRVRVWGDTSDPSSWSSWHGVETGLLTPSDWVAVMVTPLLDRDVPPLVRREFLLTDDVERARLYITAHGLFQAEINGHRVGEDELTPGWTSYAHRLRYHTYDVTELLDRGPNVIGAWLADGWYRGKLGFHGGRGNRYGESVGLMAQLEVEHADGRRTTVATDGSWRASAGPLLSSSLYDGDRYDARLLARGWSEPGHDDSGWSPVEPVERDPASLVAPLGPPVRCTETIRPMAVWESPSGRTLLDFGQNLVGRLRINVRGERGHAIRLRHAEVLEDGELGTRPLRGAEATDEYVLDGSPDESWEPPFTFHGFRYVEVTGWTGDDVLDNVEARVLHTDMRRTGHFSCSDPDLEQLHRNVVWSMRGNFLDVPTDCPQRDERLGWTGDIQVFAPTAAFLYDCTGMLGSWLQDLAAEQLPDGTVPWYVPYIETTPQWSPPRPAAVWGDAAVLTPWDLYQATGDRGLLRAQYSSARAWVDLMERRSTPGLVWDRDYQLGDWLDPAAPPDDPAATMTEPELIATAYFAWSSRQLARIAAALEEGADAGRYSDLAEAVSRAFVSRFVGADGMLTSDTQTAYSLALCFDLLPEGSREPAGDRLADLVRAADNRIATGFAGTPLVCTALTKAGHVDVAYDLLLERKCPSWLYAVEQGATTIWERWDSMLPDGSINAGNMTSFNHYALGAVANWMHETVAGIRPLEAGFRRIGFVPRPGGGLTYAAASHETPFGLTEISWSIRGGDRLAVEVLVPTGTTAVLDLPDGSVEELNSGRHHRSCPL